MSSLIIAGDTSGTVALQAPAIAGTTILTLPSTSGTVVTISGTFTAGGVAYGNGTTTAFTAVGTAGQYLTSNGTSAPTWTTITVPPATAQPFVTQFTGGNTPPTMQSSGFGLI